MLEFRRCLSCYVTKHEPLWVSLSRWVGDLNNSHVQRVVLVMENKVMCWVRQWTTSEKSGSFDDEIWDELLEHWSELHEEGIVDCLVISYKQIASRKSALPYYYIAHVAKSNKLSERGQILVHSRDHLIKCSLNYYWSPLKEQNTNILESQHTCGWFWIASNLEPILEAPL